MVNLVNLLLAILTVFGQLIIIFLLLGKNILAGKRIFTFLQKNSLFFAFVVSLIATFGSLFYSEIAHYEPCKLCWFQRIFMYPLPIILGLAIMRNYKKEIVLYVRSMAIVGGVIALYHYYLQRFGDPNVPCSAVGYSVSCAKVFLLTFGYITIPLMSATAFILILIFLQYFNKRTIQK